MNQARALTPGRGSTQGRGLTPGRTGGPGIACDGLIHMWSALDPGIRAEVEAEFAERLANASSWRKVTLQRQMRREIDRRMRQQCSVDGIY